MRLLDAEPTILQDLKDECEILTEHKTAHLTVIAGRHPTLGRLVLIFGPDGSGVVVETDE
jgi:hypothetical protein